MRNQLTTQNRAVGRRREFTNPAVTNNTYAGVLSAPFVTPCVKLASTLQNNFVRQVDGIQNKAVISSLTSAGLIQAANCDWTDGDNLTLDERVLTLTDLAVMEELCRASLLTTWAGMTGARETMSAGSPEFVNFTMATVAGKVAEGVEVGIWQGIDLAADMVGFLSNDAVFDNTGYRLSILAAGGTTGSPVAQEQIVVAGGFDAGLIISATGGFNMAYTKALANIPAILNKPDIAFYCSPKTAGAYMLALGIAGGSGYNYQVTNQGWESLQFLGIKINVCPGMFDDSIILTYAENLAVGSNLMTGYTTAQYIDAWMYDGSDNVKIAMRFGLGCQVGIPGDVVVTALTAVITDV
jgi:hypothetical protein